MSFFCRHDWVKFREPNQKIPRFSGFNNRLYSFYQENYLLGQNLLDNSTVSDYTCSKCNKMKLLLQDALEKAKIKFQKEHEIKVRRDAAKEFATKYIKLSDTAGSG